MRTKVFLNLGACFALGMQASAQDSGLLDPGATRVTLDEALEMAVRRSPALAQSAQQVENAFQSRRQTFGSFIPNLSSSSSMSIRSSERFDPTISEVVSGSSNSYSAGLSASYELFRGGARFADHSRTARDLEAAEAREEDQRFGVVLQTKQLFFSALEQAELLEVARARIDQSQQSLELAKERFRLREATRSDTLRARLDLVNARQAVLTAEANTRGARFALGRQIGLPEPVIPVAPTALAPIALELTEAEMIQIAEEASPSVMASEAALAAADAEVSSARSAWLPTVRANSSYNWSNQQASFDGGRTSWNVGFSMSYPLFNGFDRGSSIVRAEQSARVARLQDEDARLVARQQVDSALRALETAQRAIEIAEEAVIVAEEDLRINRERYRLSVAIILDVVTSQIALDQARTDLVTTRYDYIIARAQLEAVLGRSL
jgi:outer membrane protein TolC